MRSAKSSSGMHNNARDSCSEVHYNHGVFSFQIGVVQDKRLFSNESFEQMQRINFRN